MSRPVPPVRIGAARSSHPAPADHDGRRDPDLPPPPGSVAEALAAVPGWSSDLRPGRGATVRLWELLATLAADDLAVARAVEPHLDAVAILDQAGGPAVAPVVGPASTWGVFAAEGPGVRLEATRHHPGDSDDRSTWTLTGTKPWCSLADRLDAALVTAHLPEGGRGLFAVALRQDGVRLVDQPWASRGLAEIPSTPVSFDAAPAVPVGAPGWYLDRPGFWWGGIGVAACWFGGAVAVARRVLEAATSRPDDVLLAMHLGALDERLEAARLVLADAATAVDGLGTAQSIDAAADASDGSGGPDGAVRDQAAPGQAAPDQAAPDQAVLDGPVLAKRVRATVARTCEDVLRIAGHALGPAPLALEPEHAKRVADLQVYVRQQHAERDDASLGSALLRAGTRPW